MNVHFVSNLLRSCGIVNTRRMSYYIGHKGETFLHPQTVKPSLPANIGYCMI